MRATAIRVLSIAAALSSLAATGAISQQQYRQKLAASGVPYSAAAFISCVYKGERDNVALFLNAGMDPNTTGITSGGVSGPAIVVATDSDRGEVVELLLDNRAAVDAKDEIGATALVHAALSGNTAVAQILIAAGANVDLRVSEYLRMTPLMFAAREGHPEVAELLCKHGADLNAKDERGRSALVHAMGSSRSEKTLRVLLRQGADPNITGPYGRTLLEGAVEQGDADFVKELLVRGADPNRLLNYRNQALWLAQERNEEEIVRLLLDAGAGYYEELKSAAEAGNVEEVNRLAVARPELITRNDTETSRLLAHIAIKAIIDDKPEVTRALIAAGMRADVHDVWNSTPLMAAADAGAVGLVRLLLEKGAPVVVIDSGGFTAYHAAAVASRVEVMKLLTQYGFDPQKEREQTAMEQERLKFTPNAFIAAASAGDREVVARYLRAGMLPDTERVSRQGLSGYSRTTALQEAVSRGQTEVVKLLLECGASADQKGTSGETLLWDAVHYGHAEIAALLLARGSNPNHHDEYNHSLLEEAIHDEDVATVTALVDAGANVEGLTENGTPLIDAVEKGNAVLVELLIKAGADVNRAIRGESPFGVARKMHNVEVVDLLRRAGALTDIE